MADSNYITFRCPEDLRAGLEEVAADDGRKLSDVIRRACQRYVSDYNANFLVDATGKTTRVRPTE